MHRLYVNATLLYVRLLSISDYDSPGSPGASPLWIPRDNCINLYRFTYDIYKKCTLCWYSVSYYTHSVQCNYPPKSYFPSLKCPLKAIKVYWWFVRQFRNRIRLGGQVTKSHFILLLLIVIHFDFTQFISSSETLLMHL